MRTAEITTAHADATAAERIARAVRPDNTDQMTTTVDGDAITTRVERETTGGLQATVDDYVVNVTVATKLTQS